jgi:hypothetical protein
MIADVVGGITKGAKRQNDPTFISVPYLRVANVQRAESRGVASVSQVRDNRMPGSMGGSWKRNCYGRRLGRLSGNQGTSARLRLQPRHLASSLPDHPLNAAVGPVRVKNKSSGLAVVPVGARDRP